MLKLNKFILYILMSVLLSMGFPNAEDEKAVPPESTLTLEQCIDIARQKNIRLKISESEARQANSEYYLSRSRLNPQLNIAGGYTYLNPLVEVRIPGAPVTLEPMVRHNYSASATLSKLITSFGYLENFISSAREMARAKEFAHRHNVNEILFMVKLRYFKVLNTRGMTKITREQIDLTTDQLKLARNMFDEGILPRLEVLEAELRRSRSRDSLAEAEKNYYSELASFLDLIGINPSRTDIKLVGNFIEIEGYNFPNRQEMIEQALELRNDIQSARTLVLAVRKAYYGEMAGNNPQLRAMVKYENKTDTSFTNPEQWTAGVNLEIPIFDGGQ
ncbi:MAG: TolC family protein, partial [Vulcanimicrobiota bacterium]